MKAMASVLAPTNGRDRTSEFQLICSKLQQQEQQGSTLPGKNSLSENGGTTLSTAGQSEFARRAAKIGMGIHSTSQKLQRLAQLAKQTSMFDDPAEQINELATIVKQDIQALNQSITDLQTFSAGGSNKQSADHSHTVIDSLRTRLKDATKEFRDVLTLRTDNLKLHQERKSLFTSASEASGLASRDSIFVQPGASFLPASARTNPFGGPIRGDLQGGNMPQSAGNGVAEEHAPLMAEHQSSSSYQQQQLMTAPQDTYLTSRQEALHQVESTIVELGNIFQQLAHMVHEQGEMAVRIDENMDDTLTNVDAGQAQLLKYLNTISSNRWLMLKIFGVIVMAVIFFLMFVA